MSQSTSNFVSSAAGAIALTVLAVASTQHVPVAHAGRALPSSFGTRGAPAQRQSQPATSTTSGGWFSSNGGSDGVSNLLGAFRSRALKEDNKKNDKNKDKNARDDMGDDCWGWKEGWDDDEYEPCWDGTFKYELDPEGPPDRCDKWEPGDDTDDWMEVCEEWYDTYFCASDDEEAQKCGGKGKDTPLACCAGFTCGGDDKCVPLPKCAAPGTKAVGCGGAEGLFSEVCCEGSECSANGDHMCVVPSPPTGGKTYIHHLSYCLRFALCATMKATDLFTYPIQFLFSLSLSLCNNFSPRNRLHQCRLCIRLRVQRRSSEHCDL